MKFFIQFFICGLFTSFLFPPFFLTLTGFIIFPYLFYLLINKEYSLFSYLKHFISGFFFGFGFFIIYLGWLKEPFYLDELTKNYSFFSYLLIIYCSAFFGLIFCIIKYIQSVYYKFILLPFLIVASEFVCANLSYGFPWFSFSLVNASNFFGTSIIYYIGTYGLSYITIFIFLFPALFLLKYNKSKYLFYSIYLILFFLIIILILIRSNNNDKFNNINFTFSIVQLDFTRKNSKDSESLLIKKEKIVNLIKQNNTDLILFGENNYPYLMNDKNIKYLQNNMDDKQNLIIGATRKDDTNFYNSLFLINKDNFQKFDKKILVPFGEFIPLRKIFGFMEFIAGSVDFSKGNDKRILELTDKFSFLPVICYEIVYFGKLINKTNINSNFIINLTNDTWFGKFSGPYQHFYFSKLRAAEFNKPLIRVSNNGISALINNYGEVIDYIELGKNEIKNFEIKLLQPDENHLIFHKIFLIFIFLFLIIGLVLGKKNENN